MAGSGGRDDGAVRQLAADVKLCRAEMSAAAEQVSELLQTANGTNTKLK